MRVNSWYIICNILIISFQYQCLYWVRIVCKFSFLWPQTLQSWSKHAICIWASMMAKYFFFLVFCLFLDCTGCAMLEDSWDFLFWEDLLAGFRTAASCMAWACVSPLHVVFTFVNMVKGCIYEWSCDICSWHCHWFSLCDWSLPCECNIKIGFDKANPESLKKKPQESEETINMVIIKT